MIANPPKISIIIPVYNAVQTIENALKSVVNQTYAHKELIVINNLSTDGTTEILTKFQNQITCLVTEKDAGIYDAMNKALAYATGDWLYFLGSDDEFYDIQVLSNVFGNEDFNKNGDIIYGNAFYTHRKILRFKKMNRYKLAKHNFNHQTIFYPKHVFNQFKYDTRYKLWADYYLNIQLYFKTNLKFNYRNLIISNFNDKGSSGNNDDLDFIRDRKKILQNIMPLDVLCFYFCRKLFLLIKSFFKK